MPSVGDYQLERQIGAGAAGAVWKATQPGPVPRVVALKRLRAGSGAFDLARMRREAEVLSELDHPHIVRVFEVVPDGDGVALAMQYAPGGSLEDLLLERTTLAPGEVVAVAAPIADALASAHRRGVFHGDVKPANVLFTSDGEPLLGDFGVARTLGRITSDHIGGTPEYLAPELLDGGQPDPRADVYSLAVVCYRALAGVPPFTGAAPLAVVRAADRGSHRRLETVAGVPPALARAVEQAMDRNPARRFGSADGFARALRAAVPPAAVALPGVASAARPLAGGGDDEGRTRTFGPRPPRREPVEPPSPRRWRPVVVVGAVVALGTAVLLGVLVFAGGAGDGGGDGCPRAAEPAASDDRQVVAGDVDGRGCRTYGVYQLRQLAGGVQRMVLTIAIDGDRLNIGLGEPGDRLLLGDWNCDGVDTPAVYQAALGAVQYFDVWPSEGSPSYLPNRSEPAPAAAAPSLSAGDGRNVCDRVVVGAAAG
jgi:Protein kinase domain